MDMLIGLGAGLLGLLLLGIIYEQVSRRRERQYRLPGRLVDVGGYRLHMTDMGRGVGPTVVVIPGAGDTSFSWTAVQRAVAGFSRIVVYDRAGMGGSDSHPGATPDRYVSELRTLLVKAQIPGPFILVGHSLGGMIARVYATRYPREVAGMVWADSTPECAVESKGVTTGLKVVGILIRVMKATSWFGLPRFFGEVLGLMPMFPERRYYVKQISRAELRQWAGSVYRCFRDGGVEEMQVVFPFLAETNKLLAAAGPGPQFGDLPLAVVTNPSFGAEWIEWHRELARRSTSSSHRISDIKGHSLQIPRPDLIIDAIREVVDKVRT